MEMYDAIIAGGGAAGLGLAYQLARSFQREEKLLVIDRDAKDKNDRTWSFWADRSTPFDHLAYRSWDQVEVVSERFQRTYDLHPYQYRTIRGIDYYRGVRESLAGLPGISFLQARVSEITDSRDKTFAQVMTGGDQPHGARWVFDSIFRPVDVFKGPPRYHYLKQHFKGWEIETPHDAFDPHTVTLFDFRTPQKDSMRFFYILPFSARRALVEYTIFSADLLKPHEYDRAISEYLESVRGITRYRTTSTETGVIPMTDQPFRRRLGARIMAIGTRGGLVKPSSGYGFLRMQRDAQAVVRSLENYGSPFRVPRSPWRYRQFDTIMLQVMHRQGHLMKHIFLELFRNNSIQAIFRFLDEEASPVENLRLIASLPPLPFLKALMRVKLLRKV